MRARQLVELPIRIGLGTARQGFRLARWGVGFAEGQVRRVTGGGSGAKTWMDDNTLKSKVETELFRPADAPKGSVSISVVDGVVQLRGTVGTPDDVRGLEEQARRIPEVRGVENLLHLQDTPAPTRTARSGGSNQRAKAR